MCAQLDDLTLLRAALPASTFRKDAWRSMGHAALDWGLAACLAWQYAARVYPHARIMDGWTVVLTLLYWAAEGLLMWCVFVVGHDCGHGSFSDSGLLNAAAGHWLHGSIAVPFWPWALSHRQHHQFHNHAARDKSHTWDYLSAHAQDTRGVLKRLLVPFVAFSAYLVSGHYDGTHFWPAGKLYRGQPWRERARCLASVACVAAWLAWIYAYPCGSSPAAFLVVYAVPVLVFHHWLFVVTYLQHHSDTTRAYGDADWTFLRGARETVDRRYGWGLDEITHAITDGHFVHHLFYTSVPHYRLRAASEVLRRQQLIPSARPTSPLFYAEFWRLWWANAYFRVPGLHETHVEQPNER